MRKHIVAAICLAGALPARGAVQMAVPTGHVDRTYEVSVTSSFGSTFSDCFRFTAANGGELSVDLLGASLVYRSGALDTQHKRFKAVTYYWAPLQIMFFGKFLASPDRIAGEAVSEAGDTFKITGKRNEACAAGGSVAGGWNPYAAPDE